MKHDQNAGNNDIKALQTNEKQHISPQPTQSTTKIAQKRTTANGTISSTASKVTVPSAPSTTRIQLYKIPKKKAAGTVQVTTVADVGREQRVPQTPTICPPLPPGSPPPTQLPVQQDTASTIINRPPNLVNPGKRKRSPTPQPSSKDGMALRDVFFTHVKNIFAAASPELSLYSDNRTRNGEHAAYYIGWYLDRAVKCALQDLQREVRE
ncbi:unnamed protein product [Adineta steineri]|uniref:Uncharacterized protein n=1 Tax=Adineta steineri TaxID=433720 RepID=A0A819WEL0_9BILA|nr:unnamed protein product [Adineta steineri]CAF4121890.1 unnamed protein product [Adineta steineri]